MENTYRTNIGDYSIILSGWGKGKKNMGKDINFNAPEKINKINEICDRYCISKDILPKMWGFGQDTFGIYHKNNVFVTANADGHSGTLPLLTEGFEYSFYSVFFSIIGIFEKINRIKEIFNKQDEIEKFMETFFQDIDNFLINDFPETNIFNIGGSTLTLNIKFLDINGNLVSLTTNAGDSILVRFENKKIVEDTFELNCDTLESYNKYISKCNKNGSVPKEIYLGRFNTPNKYKIPWVKNNLRPIKPFKLGYKDGKYFAEEDIELMKKFYEMAPLDFKENYLEKGGLQSIRGMDRCKEEFKNGKYPSSNFGNTAEGICQCLPGSSFGDIRDKTKINSPVYRNTGMDGWVIDSPSFENKNSNMMITNTRVVYYSKNISREIIGTDGFFDTISDKELIKMEIDESNIHKIKENLIKRMFYNTQQQKWGTSWDDVSMCLLEIRKTNKKKTQENKFKKKRNNRKKRKKLNKNK